MSQLNVEVTSRVENGKNTTYLTFKFITGERSSTKIMVKKSRLYEYMYCLDNCLLYKEPDKQVSFEKHDGYVDMKIVIKEKELTYKLFDSEKIQIDKWIKENPVY